MNFFNFKWIVIFAIPIVAIYSFLHFGKEKISYNEEIDDRCSSTFCWIFWVSAECQNTGWVVLYLCYASTDKIKKTWELSDLRNEVDKTSGKTG